MINHFDKLRQQLINFSLILFSALLAFILKTEQTWMNIGSCLVVVVLMVIFRSLDYRYHKATHGFTASMFIFGQAIAYLLDKPSNEVRFFQYYVEGEKTTEKWNLQTKIYTALAVAALILCFISAFNLFKH